MQRTERLYRYTGNALIIASFILALASIMSAISLGTLRNNYLDSENIRVEFFSVRVRDDAIIYGMMYVDEDKYYFNNNSVPTILMLNGINSRKEDNIFKAFQLVKRGYAVFSVEQRGHGESMGPSGFLSKEPQDMIEVLDYMENRYDFINKTHISLYAFSYGGGIGAVLQALDERIYASVLYHPLSSLDSLLTNIPFQTLIGITPSVSDLENTLDSYDVANENNTSNLLLIHGNADILIFPEDSINFYTLLNGSNRDDINLVLRPGLDHGGVEYDSLSLRYSLLWFDHFNFNNSLNITNLDSDINTISLNQFNYPNYNFAENLNIASIVLLFLGITLLMVKFKVLPIWKQIPFAIEASDKKEAEIKYKRMFYRRSISYITPALLVGIYCALFNTSFIYGYFILYPVVTSFILLFIPSELHSNWKEEWRKWKNENSSLFLYDLVLFSIPLSLFLALYNMNAKLMIKSPIPIPNTSLFIYILMALSSGILDYLYLREMKPKHLYSILVLRPITLLIFVIFVPLPPFPLLGGLISHIFFFVLFGVFTFYIRQLVVFLSKIFKNHFSLYFLIMLPLMVFFIDIFFRIV